jgi:hypothetical protein
MTVVICAIFVISALTLIIFGYALKLRIEERNDEYAFIDFIFILQALTICFLCVILLTGDYYPASQVTLQD